MAEKAELLLQIDVDAAKKDPLLADVLLVGADGRVGGDEKRLMPLPRQRRGQRVVAHAAPTKHARCPGSDVGDAHLWPSPQLSPSTPLFQFAFFNFPFSIFNCFCLQLLLSSIASYFSSCGGCGRKKL